jgi:dienelactone hydrolase
MRYKIKYSCRIWNIVAVCSLVGFIFGAVSAAEVLNNHDLGEKVERIQSTVVDSNNRQVSGNIIITIMRPSGKGPFPLVIINHGRSDKNRKTMNRPVFESAARYFVRKGFIVAVPQRLGYGESSNDGDPENRVCQTAHTDLNMHAAAIQIRQVVDYLRNDNSVDKNKLIIVGQSVGGLATIASTAEQIPGLIASINFAGGHGGDPIRSPGNPCNPEEIERVIQQWGSTAKAPMLWIYCKNDKYFGPEFANRWHDAFLRGGGKARLCVLPAFSDNGHNLFAQGNDTWQPLVDEFLAEYGFKIPGTIVRPLASKGTTENTTQLPCKNESVNKGYNNFLKRSTPRAFALNESHWGWADGDDALSRALANCQRKSNTPCRLFAVDDDIVW